MTQDSARDGAERTTTGNVGPDDPNADPATNPGMRPVNRGEAEPEPPTQPVPTGGGKTPVGHTRAGGLWAGLILSAIVLIFLLVFIVQNGDPVDISFLAWTGSLPTGVALLLAAVAGLLLVAIPGTARIMQLRRAARRGAAGGGGR